ncbi:MAG: MmpS family transport accessory protein [Mycobacteriaceae bacterium]
MRDDDRRQRRQWPRVMFTITGVAVAAVMTALVIRSGGSVTADGYISTGSPRTVVATVAPAAPLKQQSADEVPVRLESGPAPQAQTATDLRKIVYTVDGNQRHDDPVTIIYADATGTLQRIENITLPWTLTLTQEVPVNYVMASSRGSQVNCWITDAAGSTVASQTDFATSATCNR